MGLPKKIHDETSGTMSNIVQQSVLVHYLLISLNTNESSIYHHLEAVKHWLINASNNHQQTIHHRQLVNQ